VLLNRDQLFPNSQPAATPTPPSAPIDPIARAEGLHKAGKTPIAIAQLRRIPENDPKYARAQELIAEWEGRTGAEATTDLEAAGAAELPLELAARRDGLLASARNAFVERSYFRALSRLREAAEIARLEGPDAEMQTAAEAQLAPLANQIHLFFEHEWQFALPDLWRLHEKDPADRNVTHLIVDCYYNLAVRDLQRADTRKAIDNFKEAVKLEPGDPILARHLAFAETYSARPKDLLYRIYVKYLPLR
jgi:tetratricopeptide (TPR) repeat protein